MLCTDQDPVKWMFGVRATGKVACYQLRLQEFEFNVEYLKGPKKAVAYAMSRIKTTGGKRRETPVDVDMRVFAIEALSFPINVPIQVIDNDQPITTSRQDKKAFAMDDELEPTADDEAQLVLN